MKTNNETTGGVSMKNDFGFNLFLSYGRVYNFVYIKVS